MPVACPRCSAVSNDGSAFCATCGQPLGAVVAAGPAIPTAVAPPAWAPPPGYGVAPSPQSPYFTPAMAVPPPHRLGPATTFGILGVVVAIAAAAGIVIASTRGASTSPRPAPAAVAAATPTPAAPTAPPSTGPTAAPTSAPATATPTAGAPTPAPSPGPAGVIDEQYLSSVVPAGFTVGAHTPTSILLKSDNGNIAIDTGTLDASDPGNTPAGLEGVELADDKKSSSDVAVCHSGGDGLIGTQNIPERSYVLCGTWTPAQGQAYPFVDAFLQTIATYQGKPLLIRIEFFADRSHYDALETGPSELQIVSQVVFKLYGAK